mgnify:FL=1
MASTFLRAAKTEGNGVDLWLSGFVGMDITFDEIRNALEWYSQDGRDITLNIYSHGGFLDDATAFYDWAKNSGIKFQVIVWGTAMSAATVIAAAAGKKNIKIAENASWMVHECHGGTDEMNGIGNDSLARIYNELTGKKDKEIRSLMSATTTYGAKDAVKEGWCGSVLKTTARLAAMYDAAPVNLEQQPAMADNKKTITMKVKAKLTTMEALRAAVGDGTELEVEVPVEDTTAAAIAEKDARIAELEKENAELTGKVAESAADQESRATLETEANAAKAALATAASEHEKAVAALNKAHADAIAELKKPMAKATVADNQDGAVAAMPGAVKSEKSEFVGQVFAGMTEVQKAQHEATMKRKKTQQ